MSSQETVFMPQIKRPQPDFLESPKLFFNMWSLEMRGDIKIGKLMPDPMGQKIPKDFQVYTQGLNMC